ncbi:MAG: hypothetical protein ABSD28_01940 [Tepidisphaeraceae bacterium]|jgi:hypothetical protein
MRLGKSDVDHNPKRNTSVPTFQLRRAISRACYAVEALERRVLLSDVGLTMQTNFIVDGTFPTPTGAASFSDVHPLATLGAPFTPAEIDQAYGVNNISFNGVSGNGSGQTIAIVDAYNDPDIISDTALFDSYFNLPQFNAGGPTLQVLNQTGGASPPADATPGGWDVEESLDVQAAHSIAPQANVILFEANSSDFSDLLTAVTTAADYSGVSVVSMSWGGPEFGGEQFFDSYFTTPSGHQGVTFLAGAGDSGAPGDYPAYSPNVVAVGGTTLTINSDGSYGGETGWSLGSDSWSPSSAGGGGISADESQPAYQNGNVNGISSSYRTIPDVAMDADPNSGVFAVDTYYTGPGYALEVGGTSLACPMWAGLISIADQGRALYGMGSLDGPSQTLPLLYNLPAADFHDITSGYNGFNAGPGYDLVTGIGSPVANLLVTALGEVGSPKLAFGQQPTNVVAGGGTITPAVTVYVEDANGNILVTDDSSVTLSVGVGPGTLGGTTTVAAVDGVATFDNLSVATPGTYVLTATDGSFANATSNSFSAIELVSATLDVYLSAAGPVTISASGGNITVSQNGLQATLSGFTGVAVTDTGSNDVLNFDGPLALPFSFVNCGTSTVNVNSGTLTFAAVMGGSIDLGTLFVANGAAAIITAATTQNPTTLDLNSLSIAANGVLDVTNNEMIVAYGASDPITTIAGYLKSGYESGGWDGMGIISSMARTPIDGLIYALGYADGKDGIVSGLASGQIEVKYTLSGDANLDSLVNGSDFNVLAANFNQSITGWDQGDFNYDGKVNTADFNKLSANFNQGANVAAAAPAAAPAVVSATPKAAPVSTHSTAAAPTVQKSKAASVSKAIIGATANRKPKASAPTAYAASVVTGPTAGSTALAAGGSMATSQNINKDAKFLADR